ncbi:type II toxin-antitoxin system HicA family toxin [Calditrichota bacterium]
MKPISRRELIKRMRRLGFGGPIAGKRHAIMIRGEHRVPVPNPHGSEIDGALLARILRAASISNREWKETN